MEITISNLAGLEDNLPVNSPGLGEGEDASALGGGAKLTGPSAPGVGKNEDISGDFS